MVAAAITTSSGGCFRWFNRGASCNDCPTGTGAYYGGGETYMDGAYTSSAVPEGLIETPH